MTRRRLAAIVVCGIAFAGALAYLHDPPWIDRITSGLRDWEERPPGTRYRWTNGHAAFFVPSDAASITLPLRAGLPSPDGHPVSVTVSVDDRWLASLELVDPEAWVRPTLPLPRSHGWRRHRLVEIRVSRTLASLNLGVQLGEVEMQPRGAGR